MNEPGIIRRAVNPVLLAVVIALVALGSVVVRSAVFGMEDGDGLFKRHVIGLVVGAIGMAVAWAIDYRRLAASSGPLFVVAALLILSPRVPGLGATAKGATLWLEVAGVRLFQPSEPAKLIFIVAMAAVIASHKGRIETGRALVHVVSRAAIPTLLVVGVGDLGTGLVFAAITAGMLALGGLSGRWFAVLGISAVLLVGGALGANEVLNRVLQRGPYDPAYLAADDKSAVEDTSVLIKRYQLDRLLVFIDPDRDPTGAGYNLAQSKIAIGSGELTGKGLRSGTQSNLNFLPERHTDFIFSVLGEELGFAGTMTLLGMYLVLLLTGLEVSASARDLVGALVAGGIVSMWVFQVFENIGMTVGLMPITGIPLPFMSYGASAMVTNLTATGMLLSVWSRRTA